MKLKLLAAAPAVGLLFGTPLLNNVSLTVFGLPVILWWEVFCTILTSFILFLIYRREQTTSYGFAESGASKQDGANEA